MNKAELVAEVSERTKISPLQVEQVLNFAIDIISEKMVSGEKVYLVGLGTFDVHKRLGHSATNPRTGEKIEIKAYEAPVFRAAEPLKKRVRNRNR